MAAKRYYYCADGTNVIGPFKLAEARKLLTAKVIFPETMVSSGAEEWKAARFFPELIKVIAFIEDRPIPMTRTDKTFFDSAREWQSDPPTDRQIARLKFLGASLPQKMTKGVASEMLDQLITPENQIAWDKYKIKTIDRKHSPVLAFFFSVVPGFGHFYSGSLVLGVVWFAVVIAGY